MTLEDALPNALDGAPMATGVMEHSTERYDDRDEIMREDGGPQLFGPPVALTETGSDYGDFATDEEEIINSLLGEIAPPSPLTDAPLLITDIEDYEEPKGVRIPKVLGVERSTLSWSKYRSHGQALRNSGCSSSTSHLGSTWRLC